MCRVFENFPLTSVQLESQKCASICPSVRLLNFFGQTTQVYVVIPHGVVTHHQHQECFKIKNTLTKLHLLPVPPKSWSWVQNDKKWVFKKPPPPKKKKKKDDMPQPLATPHKHRAQVQKWCLLSMFSTQTNGKLLERRFRKEF